MNLDGRLCLQTPEGALDVETASGGRFGPDVQDAFGRWEELRAWAGPARPVSEPVAGRPGPPVPRPRQVFAIGLNYREHAAEAGLDLPSSPMVFTKFPTAVAGPCEEVELPSGAVDFEAELVVVIGRTARHVSEADAWEFVAGLTVGQDLSERELQMRPPAPQQFSLAKSYAGFAPIGPVLVTPDELDDPDDVEIGCLLNGEPMQRARTSDLIFPVPALIAYLSSVVTLTPGDLVFTGTPPGVGWARNPPRMLRPGDELVTSAEGIGEMRHRLVAATRRR